MISLPEHVTSFMETFRSHSYEIWLVGGPVRDLLLGKNTDNWDFTTNAKPEQITELFPDSFYNNSFGTVGIPIELGEKKLIFEVTTFRKESSYTDHRRPQEVIWTDTIEDDLARRDFTINAIAFNGTQLVDPYNGQKDLADKIIRAVGNPDIRFTEDALRLLRAVRFATLLGFSIETTTKSSMIAKSADIQHISWERIREELFKIIVSPYAADGILLLKEIGLLKHILPELDVCFSIDQKSPNRHHIYDVGTHLVESLRFCPSTDVITRFATLLHDVGKARTYKKDPRTGQITFYNHEVAGKFMAEDIAQRFKLSNEQKERFIKLIAFHQFTVSELQTDKALRRFIRNIGIDNVQPMLDLRTGDRIGSGAKESSWRLELFKKRLLEVQQEPFTVKDLKVDGHDVMKILNIPPSRKIGDVLDRIFTKVEEKEVSNTREELLALLEEFAKEQ